MDQYLSLGSNFANALEDERLNGVSDFHAYECAGDRDCDRGYGCMHAHVVLYVRGNGEHGLCERALNENGCAQNDPSGVLRKRRFRAQTTHQRNEQLNASIQAFLSKHDLVQFSSGPLVIQ